MVKLGHTAISILGRCAALLLCFAGITCAQADDLAALRFQKIEGAFATCDIAALSELAATGGETKKSTTTGYIEAYANYRLAAALIQQDNKTLAIKVVDRGIKQLSRMLKQQPNNAEVKILLASMYGLRFIVQPYKAILQGSYAAALIKSGLSLYPNNPRGLLIQGVAKLQTPRLFGGSRELAKEILEKGLTVFQHKVPSSKNHQSLVNWGLVDTYLWLGRIAAEEGDVNKAMDYYQNALAASPDNCWVKEAIAQRGFPLAS